VLARLEHDLAGSLRGERALDRGEDRVGAEREPIDVVPGEEADLDVDRSTARRRTSG
jgi:hypothetical protein